jgi:hypothetical protein
MLTFARLFCIIALICTFAPGRVNAAPPTPNLLIAFTVERSEAAKGESLIATYQLSSPARSVSLTAGYTDGVLMGFRLPQSISPNAAGNAGVITFTVPTSVSTVSPLVLALDVDGKLLGSIKLLIECDWPWFFQPRVERCPFAPVRATPAAIQRFEHGTMIWLKESNSIWVLYDAPDQHRSGAWVAPQRVERYDDHFREGSPEFDPAYVPPAGKLQPVRGFGLVWRTQPMLRNDLGWALEPERGYTACVGYAFGGWKSMRTYLTTPDNHLIEISSYYAPTQWRVLDAIDGRAVKVTGC